MKFSFRQSHRPKPGKFFFEKLIMKPQIKDIDGTKIKTLSQRDHAIVRKTMYIGGEET